MRELFRKPTLLTKIEFWVITTIFAFVLFYLLTDTFEWDDHNFEKAPYKELYDGVKIRYNYYENYFFPQLIMHIAFYVVVLAYNFVIIPRLLKKPANLRNWLWLVVIFFSFAFILCVAGTYMFEYKYVGQQYKDDVDWSIFYDGVEQSGMVLFVLAIYTAIKYAGIYLLNISESIEAKYKFIRKEAILATAIWMVILLMLRFGRAEKDMIVGWAVVVPCAIAFYSYAFYRLIPRSLAHKSYQFFFYLLKSAFIIFIAFIVIYLALSLPHGNDDEGLDYSGFNALFQLFITVPISWVLYKRHLKGNEEINVLQKELKRSSASVDFLRSQINPHFLFNALNTLYGTAIQEKADRTSEGIQKLGDMMRFMLQENMQDKISLAREIEYLLNYIELQRLRTDSSPTIQIKTEIQTTENYYQIAPMLLIPFVENAFKHGISFREPSHIKITLVIKDGTLYFDVNNSNHPRTENDPEKDKSGIGLENVKQRLKLSYPNKHELMIRDTTKEFFAHLTIQLTKFA